MDRERTILLQELENFRFTPQLFEFFIELGLGSAECADNMFHCDRRSLQIASHCLGCKGITVESMLLERAESPEKSLEPRVTEERHESIDIIVGDRVCVGNRGRALQCPANAIVLLFPPVWPDFIKQTFASVSIVMFAALASTSL